jgi:ABC-type uncharacterized transport system permease subunit
VADRPKLGVALMVAGMILLTINALFIVAHYVEGWPIPSISLTIVGITCVILGMFSSFLFSGKKQ